MIPVFRNEDLRPDLTTALNAVAARLQDIVFGGPNTLGLGIGGTYAWRTFEKTKRRPSALLQSMVTFSGLATIGTSVKEGRPA